MVMTPGFYRLTPGSQIYSTYFNWDERSIGPYKVFFDLQYAGEEHDLPATQATLLHHLLCEPDALAVFDFNRTAIAVIQPGLFFTSVYATHYKRLHNIMYSDIYVEGVIPYKCIGYVRTFLPYYYKAYTMTPYFLIQDKLSGMVPGFGVFDQDFAQENPPMSIYAELRDTNHAGVYIDSKTGETKFLDYNPKFAHPFKWDSFIVDPLYNYYVKGDS